MAIVFVILLALAFLHFVYESVMAPFLRFRVRLALFAIRDDIRWMMIQGCAEADDEVVRDLDEVVNNAINLCSFLSLSLKREIDRVIDAHPVIKEAIDARIRRLDACTNPKVTDIRSRLSRNFGYAYLINAGGWSFLMVPPLVLVATIATVTSGVFRLIALPFQEAQKYSASSEQPSYA